MLTIKLKCEGEGGNIFRHELRFEDDFEARAVVEHIIQRGFFLAITTGASHPDGWLSYFPARRVGIEIHAAEGSADANSRTLRALADALNRTINALPSEG